MNASGELLAGLGAVAAIGAGVFSRAVFMPRSQICGQVFYRGPQTDPPRIALTFDDGPDPDVTPHILKCLNRRGVTASFFVVGRHAEKYPGLVAQIDAQEHVVANHSFEHAHLGTLRGDRYWDDEIRRTDDAIEQIIGKRPAMFRPPMGFKTFHITRAAERNRHVIVTWTRRAFDGVRAAPQRIINRLAEVRGGDIVLLHDGAVAPFRISPGATVAALDHLLETWDRREVSVQRLDQLLGVCAYSTAVNAAERASTGEGVSEAAGAHGVEYREANPAKGGNASPVPVLRSTGTSLEH